MPYFNQNNGISIYYDLISNSTKDTCVLIGGLTRDNTVWRKIIPNLKDHFQLLIPDNRDAGRSTASSDDYAIADMAEDIIMLIKHLNLRPIHLIGHSMGGFITMHIAAKNPELVKSTILCSTAGYQVAAGKDYLTQRIRLIESQPRANATTASKDDILAVMPNLYFIDNLKNSAFVDEILSHETSNPYPQQAMSFKRQAKACLMHDAREILHNINCPILIITGEYDKYYTPQVILELAAQITNSQTNIIKNASHMIQIEQPQKLCEVIKNFITYPAR